MSDLIKRLEATEEALGEECGVVPAVPNRIENVVTFDELLHFTCALLAEARNEIERLRLSCKGVEGWRMVPVALDDAMVRAGAREYLNLPEDATGADHAKAMYHAMIAAAPVSPSPLMEEHGDG